VSPVAIALGALSVTAMISVAHAQEDPNALKCRMVIANTDRATQQVTALITKLEDSIGKQQAVLLKIRDHQQQDALKWSVAETTEVISDANQQKASIAKLREYCDSVLQKTEAKQ
jgi:cellobiose phosphorylase